MISKFERGAGATEKNNITRFNMAAQRYADSCDKSNMKGMQKRNDNLPVRSVQ